MPELPEVETVRLGLNQVTLNQEIQGGDVLLNRTIAHPPDSQAFLAGLQRTAIVHWHRRGKYLLAALAPALDILPALPVPTSPNLPAHSPGGWLGVHLRMTGQLLWLNQTDPLQKHTRVRLFFPDGKELRFVDQRTFGQMWWVPPEQPLDRIMTGLQQLGPEPFSEQFSVAYFEQQLQKGRRPIKNALLDQAIVAGVGNIYADEALFLSGIRPQTLCTELNRKQIERLRQNIIQVLLASIEARGTTFSDFRDISGINGNYGKVAWVYGRNGEICRNCGTLIERLKMAGRSAHFCPLCQQ